MALVARDADRADWPEPGGSQATPPRPSADGQHSGAEPRLSLPLAGSHCLRWGGETVSWERRWMQVIVVW